MVLTMVHLPVQIPERVLAWRERLRSGSIMRKKTFKKIKRAGAAKYKKIVAGAKTAGKAYWITLLAKYLDTHPKDQAARSVLAKLVARQYRRNRIGRRGLTSVQKKRRYGTTSKLAIEYIKGKRDIITGKPLRISQATRRAVEGRNPLPGTKYYVGLLRTGQLEIFPSLIKPTMRTHGQRYRLTVGPFNTVDRAHEYKQGMKK